MGTGFTIDTPLRVARFGVSSVISLVDDALIDQIRLHYARTTGETATPILAGDPDSRARRITAYLDLVGRLVGDQVRRLQAEPFVPGSDITRYFEMLPESPQKNLYARMLAAADADEKEAIQARLRRLAVPGSIDVNIMTKLEGDSSRGRNLDAPETNDAMAALRGFASSSLASAIVFSAGLNRRLYHYAARLPESPAGVRPHQQCRHQDDQPGGLRCLGQSHLARRRFRQLLG